MLEADVWHYVFFCHLKLKFGWYDLAAFGKSLVTQLKPLIEYYSTIFYGAFIFLSICKTNILCICGLNVYLLEFFRNAQEWQ